MKWRKFMTDLIQVYQEALLGLVGNVKKRPLDHLVGFLFPLVTFFIVNYIFSLNYMANDNLVVGVARFIVYVVLLSFYLGILSLILEGNPISIPSFKSSGLRILNDVWTAYFVFSLFDLFAGNLLSGGFLTIGLFLAFNPFIEMIYVDKKPAGHLLGDLVSFYKTNILHWLLPLLIYLLILVALAPSSIMAYVLVGANPMDFAFGPARLFSQFILEEPLVLLLSQAFHYFYLLYRGQVYKIVAHSNPRKRAYMREYNDGLPR